MRLRQQCLAMGEVLPQFVHEEGFAAAFIACDDSNSAAAIK